MKPLLFRGVLVWLAGLLAACGQSGPLYLPQTPPAAGPVTPAPASRSVAPATETNPATETAPLVPGAR